MREILFRGKRKDNGEWIYGDLRQYSEDSKAIFDYESKSRFQVIPETVGQYTGYKDKDGNRVFEHDIMSDHWQTTFEVYFDTAHRQFRGAIMGGFNAPIDYFTGFPITTSVIGNIHDNPELLK